MSQKTNNSLALTSAFQRLERSAVKVDHSVLRGVEVGEGSPPTRRQHPMRTPRLVILLLLGSGLALLSAGSADARPERIEAKISYYSNDFVVMGLVHDLATEKNYEEVYQFYAYYEAIYDAQERVVVFKEYKRGKLIRTEEYRYRESGSLMERRILRPGKPVEITPVAAPASDSPAR